MFKFKKLIFPCLILVFPLSYYPNSDDSTSLWFRAGAGTGQYVSVIESCSGPVAAFTDNYKDFGAELTYRPSPDNPLYVGLRGGHISAQFESFGDDNGSLEHGYLNPYGSIEGKYIGFGLGYIRNLGPRLERLWGWDRYFDLLDFDDDLDFRKSENYASGHLRIGRVSSVYFLTSINEGVPIASQYGYFLMGLGYGGVPRWHFTTGLSGGFYDQGGFYLGVGHDMGKSGCPQLSLRLGSSENEFEGGVSLNWTIPIN